MANETVKKNGVEFLTVLTGLCKEFNPRFSYTIDGLQISISGMVIFEGYVFNHKELESALEKLKEK